MLKKFREVSEIRSELKFNYDIYIYIGFYLQSSVLTANKADEQTLLL